MCMKVGGGGGFDAIKDIAKTKQENQVAKDSTKVPSPEEKKADKANKIDTAIKKEVGEYKTSEKFDPETANVELCKVKIEGKPEVHKCITCQPPETDPDVKLCKFNPEDKPDVKLCKFNPDDKPDVKLCKFNPDDVQKCKVDPGDVLKCKIDPDVQKCKIDPGEVLKCKIDPDVQKCKIDIPDGDGTFKCKFDPSAEQPPVFQCKFDPSKDKPDIFQCKIDK